MTRRARFAVLVGLGLAGGCSSPDFAGFPDRAEGPGPPPDATPPPSPAAVCGDGVVSGGENCDDGLNDGRYGHCQAGCYGRGPMCGDGVLQAEHEACDDGINDGRYGGCARDCSAAAHCGDGVVDAGEACDDGNEADGDGCNRDCVVSGSVIWARELEPCDAATGEDGRGWPCGPVVGVVGQRAGRVAVALRRGAVGSFDRHGAPLWEAEFSGVELVSMAAVGDSAWALGSSAARAWGQRLDRDGAVVEIAEGLAGPVRAAAVDASGRLVVATDGRLRAYRAGRSGAAWDVAVADVVHVDAVAAASDGGVVVGGPARDGDGFWVEYVDSEGESRWVCRVGALPSGASVLQLAVDETGVWVGSGSGLARLGEGGAVHWLDERRDVGAIAVVGGSDALVVSGERAARITPRGVERWSAVWSDADVVVGVDVDDEERVFVVGTRANGSTLLVRLAS